MLRSVSFYFSLFLMGLSVFILISSFQIETADKSFLASPLALPIILASVMLLASMFIFIKEIKENKQKENGVFFSKPIYFLGYLILVLAYIFSMILIGFHIATFLFLGISIIYLRGTSIFKSLLTSLATTIIIVLLFGKVFEIVFPTGQFDIPLKFF